MVAVAPVMYAIPLELQAFDHCMPSTANIITHSLSDVRQACEWTVPHHLIVCFPAVA